jgi:2-octaprenyl-6-methoxyphenol hydroxylase
MEKEYDIAIVGGGLAGASLACCLADLPLRVAVFEQVPIIANDQPSYDDRGLALSLSSFRVLKAIGVWPAVAARAAPVKRIHISDRGRFGFVHLKASDLDIAALGYVIVARELGRALVERLAGLANVDFICPAAVAGIRPGEDSVLLALDRGGETGTVSCRLLVAADGTDSLVRGKLGMETTVKEYGQTAIVATITPAAGHGNTAYERFTRNGPLALLPMLDGRCVSIFTVASGSAAEYLRLDDQSYLDVLQQTFGLRLGRFTAIGRRRAYPLKLVRALRQYQQRVVLLGNAAHTVHPNGAQGFNLGLRDAAGLAEIIITRARQQRDIGEEAALQAYCSDRGADQARTIGFTGAVAGLFYNEDRFMALCRNLGMLMLDTSPSLKRRFIRMATGLYGRQPGLVRGLDLRQL